MDEAEDQINILEEKIEKKTCRQNSRKEKRIFKNEERLRNILDNMKCNNIHIMGI